MARILSECFPDLPCSRVDLLGEGWDFRAFEVDERWVFRFPKRDSSNARLKIEHALLAGLGGSLPLAVPRYSYLAEVPALRRLPQAPGNPGRGRRSYRRTGDRRPARAVAGPSPRLPARGGAERRRAERHELVREVSEQARRQLADLDDPELDLARLQTFLKEQLPAPSSAPPAVLHNDLGLDHELIDPESGQACAVIDWTDTVIAEPTVDLAGIRMWFGPAGLERALENYSGELDDEHMDRARYLSICIALHLLTLSRPLGQAFWEESSMQALQLEFPAEE